MQYYNCYIIILLFVQFYDCDLLLIFFHSLLMSIHILHIDYFVFLMAGSFVVPPQTA